MDFSANHDYQVGDVVSSMGRQITVPKTHQIYGKINGAWGWQTVGDGQVAIRLSATHINTNLFNQSGLVCYLPSWAEGYAVLSVKITHVFNKSVRAIPIEYFEANPKLDGSSIGSNFDALRGKALALADRRE